MYIVFLMDGLSSYLCKIECTMSWRVLLNKIFHSRAGGNPVNIQSNHESPTEALVDDNAFLPFPLPFPGICAALSAWMRQKPCRRFIIRQIGHEFLFGLFPQVAGIDQKENTLGVGISQQTVNGGKSLSRLLAAYSVDCPSTTVRRTPSSSFLASMTPTGFRSTKRM